MTAQGVWGVWGVWGKEFALFQWEKKRRVSGSSLSASRFGNTFQFVSGSDGARPSSAHPPRALCTRIARLSSAGFRTRGEEEEQQQKEKKTERTQKHKGTEGKQAEKEGKGVGAH